MDSKRIQVRLPDEWQDAVGEHVEQEGLSLSEWVRKLIYRGLPAAVRKTLPDVKVGRPKQ